MKSLFILITVFASLAFAEKVPYDDYIIEKGYGDVPSCRLVLVEDEGRHVLISSRARVSPFSVARINMVNSYYMARSKTEGFTFEVHTTGQRTMVVEFSGPKNIVEDKMREYRRAFYGQ